MGETITLRRLEAADWAAVHSWSRLPEFCRFQSWGPNTETETCAFVAEAAAAWSQDPQTRYVFLARLDERPVGRDRQRHTMLIRDGWRDSEMFSVLEDEWRVR